MIKAIEDNKKWIDEVWNKLEPKMEKVAKRSYDKIPYTAKDGVHDDRSKNDVSWWTNGFWGGMMWLMYVETKKELYKDTAEHSEELLSKALENFESLHHDVGFMWHLTSGANYRITGNKKSCNTNLFLASTLASRYNIDGKFIRAWNGSWNGAEDSGWSIIDCLMNVPLLYWASDVVGDPRFKRIAMSHTDMALRDHVRADGSVNHIVEHDTETGEFVKAYAGQGYSETSCWSRGLAWAVYGLTIGYKHTGKKEYLDGAIRCANYFVANCAKTDYLPLLDFRQPDEPVYYDSTAGACTACGLLELAKFVSGAEAEMYTDSAIKMMKAMDERCCNYDENVDYLVGMGSERYPCGQKNIENFIHIPIIYGDFFFVEAMLKLRGNEFFIW